MSASVKNSCENRPTNCVMLHEMSSESYCIGLVHPGEDDEHEIYWDMSNGNIYIEQRDPEFENSTDSFGIKNGRRGSLGWFFLIGNCKSDNRSDAEEEMMKLVETAELL